jgi:peptidoglycan/xylan/chitin deacetylase (PgdA/CDA1 family)
VSSFKLILCTHDLAPTPIAQGDELLCWLPFDDFREMFADLETLTAQSGVELELTSDDAFASDYELLFPWLLETRRTATFFIPTAFLGRPGRLTREQVREMRAAGMHIGAHGTNHIDWVTAPADVMRSDIATGLRDLEDLLGERIATAAPPFSSYNREVLSVLRDEGINEVHSCRGGYAVTVGSLRSRAAISRDAAINARIIDIARRAPGGRDLVRGMLHNVQAVLN